MTGRQTTISRPPAGDEADARTRASAVRPLRAALYPFHQCSQSPLTDTSPDPTGGASDWTLPDLAVAVRSGQWANLIGPIRALAQYKNEKRGNRKSSRAAEYSHLKDTTLPYAVVSGTWRMDHRHADGHSCKVEPCPGNGMLTASGLRLLDLDDLGPDAQADIKRQLDNGAVPWAAACWKSPGGDGLHVFAMLDPAPTCQADSHSAFTAVLADLAERLPRRIGIKRRIGKKLDAAVVHFQRPRRPTLPQRHTIPVEAPGPVRARPERNNRDLNRAGRSASRPTRSTPRWTQWLEAAPVRTIVTCSPCSAT